MVLTLCHRRRRRVTGHWLRRQWRTRAVPPEWRRRQSGPLGPVAAIVPEQPRGQLCCWHVFVLLRSEHVTAIGARHLSGQYESLISAMPHFHVLSGAVKRG